MRRTTLIAAVLMFLAPVHRGPLAPADPSDGGASWKAALHCRSRRTSIPLGLCLCARVQRSVRRRRGSALADVQTRQAATPPAQRENLT